MRDIGYSFETAAADLVDNSISAGASSIDLICNSADSQPTMIIVDNGSGMTEAELLVAMRHGTGSPRQHRSAHDLGRFGLGLKTASFSQCRSLTVISAKAGKICGAEWDLDRIDAADDWVLRVLDTADMEALPAANKPRDRGTVVIWQKLDRLTEIETGDRRDEIINEKLDAVARHLALVFHRFMSGEIRGKKVAISVNGRPIQPFDPFCRKNSATQMMPEETVRIGKSEVRLQPYILPHHSRLSVAEYDFYQDRSDFISNQGAYIYRNGRLMAWGDWFRLVPKGEATKLARVQIDFPNSLDEAWTIDIKKARARPPLIVRERLRQIIAKIVTRSVSVHRGRGQKLIGENHAPLWERYADQEGIRFAINERHPLIILLSENISAKEGRLLRSLLNALAGSLPIEMIYSDYSTHPREISRKSADQSEIMEALNNLHQVMTKGKSVDSKAFMKMVRSIPLFENHIETAENFLKEIQA